MVPIRHFIKQNKNLKAARYHFQFNIISSCLLSSYSAWGWEEINLKQFTSVWTIHFKLFQLMLFIRWDPKEKVKRSVSECIIITGGVIIRSNWNQYKQPNWMDAREGNIICLIKLTSSESSWSWKPFILPLGLLSRLTHRSSSWSCRAENRYEGELQGTEFDQKRMWLLQGNS